MAGIQRHSVIMAGIGGRGVMVAALTLAQAALKEYPHAVWLPSMTTAQRGGPCEATVVFSRTPIASPLVWRPDGVVIMEASQLKPFEPRVVPGGVIVTEKEGLKDGVKRSDLRVLALPALSRSVELTGDTQAANLVLLGAYIEASGALSSQLIERELEERFGAREKVFSQNLAAFREGIRLAKALAG